MSSAATCTHSCMIGYARRSPEWATEAKAVPQGKEGSGERESNCGRPWSCVWAVFVSLQWTHRVLDLRPLSGDLALPRRVRACKRWIIRLLWTRQMPPCIVCRSRGCAEPVEACSQHVNWTELQSTNSMQCEQPHWNTRWELTEHCSCSFAAASQCAV